MNILLTSVGRRAYMVKYFRQVLAGDGMVHVCNSDDRSVAFHYADRKVCSPLIYDEGYIPFLLEYCQNNSIDLVISLFDMDLLMLAKHKAAFAAIGTRVLVSDPELIAVCNDKWKTYLFLKENGFCVPDTYLTLQQAIHALNNGSLQYPVVVKPRFGCGSIAMSVAEDETDLLYGFRRNTRLVDHSYLKYESAAEDEKILCQQCLQGQEYGADIMNDLDGNFKHVVIKKKIAMRAGETDIAEIVDVPAIREVCERLGRLTRHIGNMDVDVFLVDGKPYILEMNARFGGGYPFSHMAGCDLPRAIVQWAKGEPVEPEILQAKVGMLGYKELVITNIP